MYYINIYRYTNILFCNVNVSGSEAGINQQFEARNSILEPQISIKRTEVISEELSNSRFSANG